MLNNCLVAIQHYFTDNAQKETIIEDTTAWVGHQQHEAFDRIKSYNHYEVLFCVFENRKWRYFNSITIIRPTHIFILFLI